MTPSFSRMEEHHKVVAKETLKKVPFQRFLFSVHASQKTGETVERRF